MKTKHKAQAVFPSAAAKFVFHIALIMTVASVVAAQTNTFPASGNAGVGTTSPTQLLQINSNTSGGGVLLSNNASSAGTYTPIQFKFDVGPTAEIRATKPNAGTGFGTGINTDLSFRVWDAAVAGHWSDALYLKSNGSVGIGTASPAEYAKLHVYGSGGFGQDIQTSTNDWTRLRFVTPGRTLGFFLDGGAGGNGAGKFGLYDYTVGAWRMMVDTSGSVGFGTATPTYKLDVQGGQINSSGGLCIAGDCKTAWSQVGGGGSSQWTTAGANIHYSAGNVGVGTTSPAALFDVRNSDGYFYAGFGYGANKETFLRAGSSATGVLHIGDLNTSKTLLQEGGGNVGIGTTAPTEKLHVQGNGKVTGNLTVDGNINAKYQDVAEWVPSSEQLSAGTVVVLDQSKSNQVVSSSTGYDTRVAGVISAQPGITLGESGEGKVLVATTGRVRVKVDASRGAIQIGDLLVTSDVPGVAMKSEPVNLGGVHIHRPGTIIGKALETIAGRKGEILVLLSLQ